MLPWLQDLLLTWGHLHEAICREIEADVEGKIENVQLTAAAGFPPVKRLATVILRLFVSFFLSLVRLLIPARSIHMWRVRVDCMSRHVYT